MKGKSGLVPAVVLALTVALGAAATAATAPAKNTTTTNKATKGTTQLKGDQAQIGTTYTLGKQHPINITLDSVEYSVEQLRIAGDLLVPKANEKLMVLHYTLHNPNPRDYGLSWGTLKFTAVDAVDTNWKYCSNVAMEGTGEKCYMSLKPAQKTKLFTAIVVPAAGEIPKLIVESNEKLVLRYDLRGKVKRLAAPYADPADATGATPLAEVPATVGTAYSMHDYDVKVDSFTFSETPIPENKLKSGYHYLVMTVSAKNDSGRKSGYSWNRLKRKLVDQDGMEIKCLDYALLASRDEKINATIEPGQEVRCRYFFPMPKDTPLKSLYLKEVNDERTYVFDMSGVK